MRNNPKVKNNSLFVYVLVLLKRLPSREYKAEMLNSIQLLLTKYEDYIDMELIGFPRDYYNVLNNSIR